MLPDKDDTQPKETADAVEPDVAAEPTSPDLELDPQSEPKPEKAKKKSKASHKEEDITFILERFKYMALAYGDPAPGEDPQYASQRERAIRCQKIVESKFKK